ncbi:uncharacterized protein PAC_17028 [Phialocephala subalpina]|uniref:BTB domain-containing protein n=1 Tax=Phialocephala subalpina TaxID=576137 RepID=A0A1L7XQ31_9HELO|nr:uncharacterized protein PAC_17028 [Phialocephala subalpina]
MKLNKIKMKDRIHISVAEAVGGKMYAVALRELDLEYQILDVVLDFFKSDLYLPPFFIQRLYRLAGTTAAIKKFALYSYRHIHLTRARQDPTFWTRNWLQKVLAASPGLSFDFIELLMSHNQEAPDPTKLPRFLRVPPRLVHLQLASMLNLLALTPQTRQIPSPSSPQSASNTMPSSQKGEEPAVDVTEKAQPTFLLAIGCKVVELTFGERKEHLVVHKKLLCERIPCFRKIFNGDSKEALSKSATFSEDYLDAMEVSLYWAYHDTPPKLRFSSRAVLKTARFTIS